MIAVDAALIAESTGLRVRIDGSDRVLTCHIDGDPARVLGALRHVRRLLPAVRSVVPVLMRLGLRVEVVAGAVKIAQIGSGVQQNALARILRLPATRVGRR